MERQDDTEVSFLLQTSQALWNEPSIKGLLKKFVALLTDHFETRHFTLLTLTLENQRVVINNHQMRFAGTAPFADDYLDQVKAQLITLQLISDEFKDGINTMVCGGRELHFALVGDPSVDWMALVWEKMSKVPPRLKDTLRAVSDSAALELRLDFLVRQLQSECRWFCKLDRTQALLYRDDLTGLFNYRYLDIALDSELRRAQRFQTCFCLLFIDLDDFKAVNDKHGHLVGSSLLKQVAEVLQASLREVDSVIRYGGDEYIVILLGANSKRGLLTAERLRRNIETATFRLDGGLQLSITASVGVASYPEHGRDKETLIKLADETMYRSKRGGKNRVALVSIDKPANFKDAQGSIDAT